MSAISQPSPQPGKQPGPQPVIAAPPAPPEKPNRRWIGVLATVIVVGAAIAWVAMRQSASATDPAAGLASVETAPVVRGKLVKTIRAGGQTAAVNFANISAPEVRGRGGDRSLTIIKLAPAGVTVKRGDVIAEFDATTLQDSLDDQRAVVEVAEANLAKKKADLEVEWETFQQTLLVAKANFDKAALDLKTTEVRSEIEAEILKLTAEETDARNKQLQKDIALRRASQQADIRLLELEVADARQDLVDLENNMARFTVRAPRDGLVVLQSNFTGGEMRQVSEGEQVRPGRGFMKIVDPSVMVVEAVVNQSESESFALGQHADIGFDAFPDMKMKGSVSALGALASGGWRENYYIRSIPIRVVIEKPDARVIPDLSAFADVEVRSKENALLVPRNAIQYDGDQAYVIRKAGKGTDRVPVQVELTNASLAAVAGPLEEGDQIVIARAVLSSR
ncbi:MAG: efflux RND transporter periplasmic adaptor subunit [Bryobacterales bacterium]|nr:efflux RND transporter periplasmic adaptor subunit [Bryobacterales bacterium]